MRNGDIVAVKKLSLSSDRVKAEFESEVRLISNVHHRNLVRLLGCADKGAELLLVYEYMANGSLDKFLYGNVTFIFKNTPGFISLMDTHFSLLSLLHS